MARPRKMGLDYFPLDTDFLNDNKIRILKARYKNDGVIMYLFLLAEIYRSDNGYYIQVDDDFEYILSDQLFMDINKVKQVLNFLLKRSLFNDKLFSSDKVLTSAGIQRRWQLAKKEAARKTPVKVGRYWLLSEEETEPFIKCTLFEINPGKTNDYSGKNPCNSAEESLKKSKVNTIYNITFPSEEVEKLFQMYLSVHAHNYTKDGIVTPEQEAAMREELLEISSDEKEQLSVLRKATAGAWKNLHKLKKEKAEGKQSSPKKNPVNFKSRDYDYDALEEQLIGKPRRD